MKYFRKDKFTRPATPLEALKLALAKEKSSYEFYEKVAQMTQNPALKKLLNELKDAEAGHIKKIQNKLKSIGINDEF
jgi:rubrerythrin